MVGSLTRIGETTLPDSIVSAANSTAPWVLATFLMILVSGLAGRLALVLGAASFVAMDLSFFVTFGFTGGYYPRHYLAFWLVVALIAGPLVALMATWVRRRGIRWPVAAASVPSVFIGEGVFVLVRLPIAGHVYPAILIVGGILILAGVLALGRRTVRESLLTVGLTVVGTAVFSVAYNLVPLVIGKVVP